MHPVYQQLREASILPGQFLAYANQMHLTKDGVLGYSTDETLAGQIPPALTIGQSEELRVRLLSGHLFVPVAGSSATSQGRHFVYAFDGDMVVTDEDGETVRVGPFEPIEIGAKFKRLHAFGAAPVTLLELAFGPAAGPEHGLSVAEGRAGEVPAPHNSYYWDFEARYVQTYGEGGDSWESLAPNRALDAFLADHGEGLRDIIDLGTGEGRDAIYLAEKGYRVTGVDVAATGLDKARELAAMRGVAPTWLLRDVVHLRGFENDSFDAALNMGCLHLIDVPAQRSSHLKRVFDILRPGGLFLLGHCRSDWLKDFWSVDSYEAVKEKGTGEMIATRIRKADGASFLTEMPILRHVERSDAALQEELIAAGFEAAGEYNVRNINDLGNVCVLLARKPLAPAAGAANV